MIDKAYINQVLNEGRNPSFEDINRILEKAAKREKLSHLDIAMLLHAKDPQHEKAIYDIAGKLKEEIYGSRVVMFAPLYISNFV